MNTIQEPHKRINRLKDEPVGPAVSNFNLAAKHRSRHGTIPGESAISGDPEMDQSKLRKLPVVAGQKKPSIADWWNSATSDAAQLASWNDSFPHCNWGIACGHDGLVVVDIDCKNGKDGFVWLREQSKGDLPKTYTVDTPTGGKHYYFRVLQGVPVTRHLPEGVDIQGNGAQVLSEGSTIILADGGEGVYRGNGKPIAKAPDWLVSLLKSAKARPLKITSTSKSATVSVNADVGELQQMLSAIDSDLDYNAWRNVIWSAISSYGSGQHVYESTKDWSRSGQKWDETTFEKVWHSFDASRSFDSLAYWTSQWTAGPEHFLPHVQFADRSTADTLAETVYQNTMNRLIRDGNKLSSDHKEALSVTAKALVYSGFTDRPKRLVIPLFTGGGKTQSVIAYAAEASSDAVDRGLWIAVSTIDEINEIAEGLEEAGVPKSKIGKRHSGTDSNANNQNAHEFPLLLVTHERIRIGDYDALMKYKDRQRHLIWDEALLTTKAEHMPIMKLVDDLSIYRGRYETLTRDPTPIQEATYRYYGQLLDVLNDVVKKDIVDLPNHPGALDSCVYGAKTLRVLENPTSTRAIVDKEKHVFWFVVQVPDEFTNIVILDASAGIKKLEQFDTSIEFVRLKAVKDYSAVKIHVCKFNQGKHTINDPTKNRVLYQELAYITEELIPQGQGIVCYHLPEQEGVEPAPQRFTTHLSPRHHGKVIFKSWGEARGVNHLREYRYGFHIGMIFRDANELKAAIAGQKRDATYEGTDKERHRVQVSEHAEQVYQGISRLACRKTENGKAAPTEFWLFYPTDKVLDDLREVMPGIVIEQYESKFIGVDKQSSAQPIVDEIIDWLVVRDFKLDGRAVTIDELRKELNLTGIKPDSRQWKKIRGEVKKRVRHHGYELRCRKFVKPDGDLFNVMPFTAADEFLAAGSKAL